MIEENQEGLERLTNSLLCRLDTMNPSEEAFNTVFEAAMKSVSKEIELTKIENSHDEELSKLNVEKEKNIRDDATRKSESKTDRKLQFGIFAIGLVASPVINMLCKKSLGKQIAKIEEFEVFKTSIGKSVSGWFKD